MVAEYIESLDSLKVIVKKYAKNRVKFTNNGFTRWPTKEAISEFTDDYISVDRGGFERYVANIPEDSEVFRCNKKIALALHASGIKQCGAPFVSLAQCE